MATKELTADALRRHLQYSPETGLFTRIQKHGTAHVGDIAGWLEPTGYVKVSVLGRKYYAHRLAFLAVTGRWPSLNVDHRNGCRSDNRFANLRDVSQQLNTQNLKRARLDNAAGLLGVWWHKGARKYAAGIKDPAGKAIHLGLFSCAEDAHEAYLEAKRRLHAGSTL